MGWEQGAKGHAADHRSTTGICIALAWLRGGAGRRDLIHSVPDVLASTANYLKGYGWQRGQPWGEGTANFQVLLQWNASQVYTKTVAAFAQQLADGR